MTPSKLAPTAQRVQDLLHEKGLSSRIIEFPAGTRTSADAARCIGCDLAQIAKTLIFKTKQSHRPVMVIASGPNRVDERVIAAHIGETITKADADFVREATGYAIGGVSAFGHPAPIELSFVDQDLLAHEIVWSAAGTPHAVYDIPIQDLISLTHSTVIAVTKGA